MDQGLLRAVQYTLFYIVQFVSKSSKTADCCFKMRKISIQNAFIHLSTLTLTS